MIRTGGHRRGWWRLHHDGRARRVTTAIPERDRGRDPRVPALRDRRRLRDRVLSGLRGERDRAIRDSVRRRERVHLGTVLRCGRALASAARTAWRRQATPICRGWRRPFQYRRSAWGYAPSRKPVVSRASPAEGESVAVFAWDPAQRRHRRRGDPLTSSSGVVPCS